MSTYTDRSYSDVTPSSATTSSQRIYSLSMCNSEETLHTNISRPSVARPPSPDLERMRILLAPYMSPYVVPVHRVLTWEALHRTLHALFGADVFNGSPLRITDDKGDAILPALWTELLEPNMTIVVDTCSCVPESTLKIFQPALFPHRADDLAPPEKRTDAGDDAFESATAMVLADRERDDEDADYAGAGVREPRGMIGELAGRAMRSSLKARSAETETALKRQTSVSMFAGRRPDVSTRELYKPTAAAGMPFGSERAPKQLQFGHSYKISSAGEVEEVTVTDRASKPYPRSPNPAAARPKSAWSRVAKALIFLISAGKTSQRKRQTSLKRSISNPSRPVHYRSGSVTVLERLERPTSLTERRGVASLARVDAGVAPFEFPPAVGRAASARRARGENRRSRSLGSITPEPAPSTSKRRSKSKPSLSSAFPARTSSLSKHTPATSSSAFPARTSSLSKRNPSTSAFPARTSSLSKAPSARARKDSPPPPPLYVSPPIPQRPREELGVHAQYRTPGLDREQLHEYVKCAESDENVFDGSSSTWGTASSQARAWTVESATAAVVEEEPDPTALDKPLPKLPHKFSPFPPPSPPRTPLEFRCRGPDGEKLQLPEADRRPRAEAASTGKSAVKTLLRKTRSTSPKLLQSSGWY